MTVLAPTDRQQKRQRDALRAARRDKTLESLHRDESEVGQTRARPGAAVIETASLGRLAAEPSVPRASPQELILPTLADQDLVAWRALTDLDDRDLLEEDPRVGSSLTLADVIRTFGLEYRRRYGRTITVQQDRALRDLTACYTPLMGTHEWTCDDCGTVVELPNACNNRHCPTCGDLKRSKWAEMTASQILPVEYYHVILTVPRQITQLAMANPHVLYPLMLQSGAEAILRCGRKLFQAELALLSLLHSWGNLVNAHLHSHSMFPAGGLWTKALQWIALSREQIEDLLLLVSVRFPRRFIQGLRKAHGRGQLTFEGMEEERETLQSAAGFDRWLESFNTTRWVIRCPQVWDRREVQDDAEAALNTVKYLARYANRVALSNDRVVGIENECVLLRYKDYRDGDQWKTTSIDGVEFIGRFLQHLLPQGMHHIRRYGWMNRRAKNEKLAWLQEYFQKEDSQVQEERTQTEESEEDPPRETAEEPSRPCRYCQGTLHLTGTTRRPKVSEILVMPLAVFLDARAGPIVTLSEKAKEIAKLAQEKNAETGREQAPLPISALL